MDSVQVPLKQIAGRPRRIGTWKGRPVVEVVTKGGYNLVMHDDGKRLVPLGAGPHRAISRAQALKNEGLQIEEVSKADYVPPEAYAHLLAKYEMVTARLRAAWG